MLGLPPPSRNTWESGSTQEAGAASQGQGGCEHFLVYFPKHVKGSSTVSYLRKIKAKQNEKLSEPPPALGHVSTVRFTNRGHEIAFICLIFPTRHVPQVLRGGTALGGVRPQDGEGSPLVNTGMLDTVPGCSWAARPALSPHAGERAASQAPRHLLLPLRTGFVSFSRPL